ncbi:heterokaryon incompatibility protein-domain-containing protein [Colletotrichum godetiae]|uniref:Heterokaryon incompatibility protein-domain-containing protein n=1 Tax=Colletotrichum godetiae TaxID=1209918 RepID=A0AAJ0A6T8_9PEZI|nr:heterokaryon incompatibility protein-domain-containing protein [Colletotrichum godetiae]KAK1657553.1 heterokaryon incompatibility protein-domain-containing protein [Colletotrichum godetiae]
MDRRYFRSRKPASSTKAASSGRNRSQSPPRSTRHFMNLKPLTHEPLRTSRSIRVVQILKFNRDNLEIFATLHQVRLCDTDKDTTNYVALSYTWGYPVTSTEQWGPYSAKPEKIVAKAKLILVNPGDYRRMISDDNAISDCSWVDRSQLFEYKMTENLSDFLMSLTSRSEERDAHIPLIWIDAICIDQTNPQEKAVQIPLMGEIYAKSSAVYIWLGKHDRDLEGLFWMYRTLLPAIKERQKKSSSLQAFFQWLQTYGPGDERLLEDLGLKPEKASLKDCWITYIMFFTTRSWFFRAWTLQEAVVASNPVFVIGNDFHVLSWADTWDLRRIVQAWSNGLSELTMYNEKLAPELRGTRLIRGWTEIFPLRSVFSSCLRADNRDEWVQTWSLLLFFATAKDCTVTVDRLYSTFGMAKMICPAEVSGFPVVDFSRSAAEVFTQVARFLICNSGGLSLLSLVTDRTFIKTAGMPSWVPDFAIKGDQGHLLSSVILRRDTAVIALLSEGRGPAKLHSSRAMMASLAPFHCTTNTAEALWRTLIYDFGETPTTPTGAAAEAEADPRHAQGFKQWLTIDLTTCLNRDGHGLERHESREFGSILSSKFQKAHSELIPSLDEVHQIVHYVLAHPYVGHPSQLQGPLGRAYHTLMTPIIMNRRLFITDEGYIGLGKLSSRVGDEVWVLAGGKVPYVMRPREDGKRFSLVGDAYVHGLMDGNWSMSSDAIVEDVQVV